MIAENPFKGYGYGLFERNYNLKQASYFANQTSSNTERRNASFVAMAYNDYLEQTIEGGILGLLFYSDITKVFVGEKENQLVIISK